MTNSGINYSWLFDDMTKVREKILFKDRIEYRVGGKLHNVYGPAVLRFKNLYKLNEDYEEVEYWIKGEKITEQEWKIQTREVKLKKIMNKIKSNSDD